jgi:hypothetical protein
VKEGERGGNIVYSGMKNGKRRPVETILRRGKGEKGEQWRD